MLRIRGLTRWQWDPRLPSNATPPRRSTTSWCRGLVPRGPAPMGRCEIRTAPELRLVRPLSMQGPRGRPRTVRSPTASELGAATRLPGSPGGVPWRFEWPEGASREGGWAYQEGERASRGSGRASPARRTATGLPSGDRVNANRCRHAVTSRETARPPSD